MKKRSVIAIFLIVSIVLALSLSACNLFGNTEPTRYYIDISQVEDARTASIVANNTIASCVRIITEYNSGGTTTASSGFVITEDGYVVTNRHCVARFTYSNGKVSDLPQFASDKPMAANYSIVFADNRLYSATLVDWSITTDIALLKIDNVKGIIKNTFQPLVFETERELYYGERVYTIGNPDNMGLIFTELSIASPTIRFRKKVKDTTTGKETTVEDTFDSVVLDGNINHGNSGGPVLNAYSRVSAIVYARLDGELKIGADYTIVNNSVYGLGCAIATDEIIKFLDNVKGVKIDYKTTPKSASSGNNQ